MKRLLLCCLAVTLTACEENPYEKFYRPVKGIVPDALRTSDKVLSVELENGSGDFLRDERRQAQKGLILFGAAAFGGPQADFRGAVAQASKVNADVVVASSKFSSLDNGASLVSTTSSSISSSSGSVGSAPFGATSLSSGSSTSLVPTLTAYFKSYAGFFKRAQRTGMGIGYSRVSNRILKQIGSSKAEAVAVVMDGSPAYQADIIEGDVIISVDGIPAKEFRASYERNFTESSKRLFHLKIWRDGKVLDKTLNLDDWDRPT